MRALIVVCVLAVTARGAEARPKVPKELAGVELGTGQESYELVAVKVARKVKRLGGREVVAFTHRYRTTSGETHELVVMDRASKDWLFRLDVAGEAVGWKDYDGDGEMELTVGKGDGARIWQVRYGRMIEMSAELATCGRPSEDVTLFGSPLPATGPRAAADRFVAAVEQGVSEVELRCLYGDALLASDRFEGPTPDLGLYWPEKGAEFALSPIAIDCPAAAWAERHGIDVEPVRIGAFVTHEQRLALFTVNTGGIDVELVLAQGGTTLKTIVWSQSWVFDERLHVLGEWVTTDGAHRAFVYDVVGESMVFQAKLAKGASVALQMSSATSTVFELVTGQAGDQEVLWRLEPRTWGL